MFPYLKINNRCINCDNCVLICPEDAISQVKNEYFIEHWSCTLCSLCQHVCPVDCIELINLQE